MQSLKVNSRVLHPKRLEWGQGKVLESLGNNKYRIFFANKPDGVVVLSTAHVALELVPSKKHDPFLNHINAHSKIDRYQTPTSLEERFMKEFPKGFDDPLFYQEERNYKLKASRFLKESLGDRTEEANQLGDSADVCKLAKQTISKTNLIFPNESMDLNDGLRVEVNQSLFAEAFVNHLLGENSLEARFNEFVGALYEINAAKWTTATYFLHLFFPEECPFMKPVIMQRAAEAYSLELNYKPTVNWETYSCLIGLMEVVRASIAHNPLLIPRDMIDIQSFLWCSVREET